MSEKQELYSKIVHQVEYYFGDVNLLRDKFLQFEIKEHGGWVPIDSLLRCNRLKQICGDGTEVLNALVSSSELMDVDTEQRQVRRDTEKFPLPANAEELFRDLNVRTLYVKGFEPTSRLDTIYEYIGPDYKTQVVQVTLRKNPKDRSIFKGSVFVAFKARQDAEKFLNDPEKAKFRDKDVILKFKNDYFDEKKKERDARKAETKATTMNETSRKKVEEEKARMIATQPQYKSGMLLRVSNLPKNAGFREMREFFARVCDVAWIDIADDQKSAIVRLGEGSWTGVQVWRKLYDHYMCGGKSTSSNPAASPTTTAEKPEATGAVSTTSVKEECPAADTASSQHEEKSDVDKSAAADADVAPPAKMARIENGAESASAAEDLKPIKYRDALISVEILAGDEEKAFWDKLITERAERRVYTKLKKNDSRSRNAQSRAEAASKQKKGGKKNWKKKEGKSADAEDANGDAEGTATAAAADGSGSDGEESN